MTGSHENGSHGEDKDRTAADLKVKERKLAAQASVTGSMEADGKDCWSSILTFINVL